ncbi:zinc finger RNA-binding protein 2 isoform X2 [Ambystoma mexicanum]|uniref:zinc finger RNA-binding protein 2 isoform X2 n=1 Tax=Ambystoma mexicanum TaxID=8296 RepID=UPI0037E83F26
MAASNYYGFPHAALAPPYSTPPAYCHPATAATYAVQQVPSVGHTINPAYAPVVQAVRPVASVAYGAYPTHVVDYGYGTRQPEPPPQPVTTTNYQDTYSYGRATPATNYENKQYYQPVATQAAHTPTDSYYQTGSKGGYNQSSGGYTQRQVTPIKPVQSVNSASPSYVVYPVVTTVQQSASVSTIPSYTPTSTYNSTPVSYSGTSYTSYDPNVYSAASTYYHPPPQQHAQPPPQLPPPVQPQKPTVPTSWSNPGNSANTDAVGNFNKKKIFQNKQVKPKGPPKQRQIHYCDICKISCAGPQTYREHLEGQKHKKKEVVQKSGNDTACAPLLCCELCDVACTGADAYAAHIRGSKHQKVVKLHTKLGKPIPSVEPIVVNFMSESSTSAITTTTTITPAGKPAPSSSLSMPATPVIITVNSTNSSSNATPFTKLAPAKITFVGSSKLQPLVAKAGPLVIKKELLMVTPSRPELQNDNFTKDDFGDNLGVPAPSVNPVGHEFVEEACIQDLEIEEEARGSEVVEQLAGAVVAVKNTVSKKIKKARVCNDEGKMIRFHCKLCECSFNDPNAKDMHLKGRRHRLQFKKKVNPQFPVEIKPSNRGRKLQEEKMKKLKQKDLIKRRRDDEQRFHLERRRYEQDMYWRRVEEKMFWEEQRRHRTDWQPPPLMGRPGLPVPPLLPNRHPDSFDDRYIMFKHSKIYPTEEELQAIQRLVSHSERSLKLVSDSLSEQNTNEMEEKEESKEKGKKVLANRCLKGVMRVGVLAKGLLLRGDRSVNLVVLSDQKPTTSLLQKVTELLPKKLSAFTQDKYEVSLNVKESFIVIASCKEPKMQVVISIASPIVKDEEADKEEEGKETHSDPSDLISKQKCMDCLSALRHAKWFQACANGLQSCVIVIRILRDLCQRVPTWSALPDWAMELLVERVLSSVSGPLGPGDALRRVLECVASGILLPGGPGLQDPCEKDQIDALETMTNQQRQDITASAQHALRMVAFRQIYKVLGIDPFPPSKHKTNFYNRKRRRETTEVEGEGEGKKDKKDDTEEA